MSYIRLDDYTDEVLEEPWDMATFKHFVEKAVHLRSLNVNGVPYDFVLTLKDISSTTLSKLRINLPRNENERNLRSAPNLNKAMNSIFEGDFPNLETLDISDHYSMGAWRGFLYAAGIAAARTRMFSVFHR